MGSQECCAQNIALMSELVGLRMEIAGLLRCGR